MGEREGRRGKEGEREDREKAGEREERRESKRKGGKMFSHALCLWYIMAREFA